MEAVAGPSRIALLSKIIKGQDVDPLRCELHILLTKSLKGTVYKGVNGPGGRGRTQ